MSYAKGNSLLLESSNIIWTDATTRAFLVAGMCLLFALLMQVAANFINDYYDFRRGTDREDRLGPERACAQGWITPRAMRIGIAVVVTLACLVGLGVMLLTRLWWLVAVGVACVAFAFLYTTRLSYLGWGDVLVVVFFGIVPVGFTFCAMTDGAWTMPVTLAGFAMGLATDNLLLVNNYRDRNEDAISGKRTIVVRLASRYGDKVAQRIARDLYIWIGILAAIVGLVSLFIFPFTNLRYPLLLLYLIMHFRSGDDMHRLDGRDLNRLLGISARNIFFFGLMLTISFII